MRDNLKFVLGDRLPTIYDAVIQINDISPKPIEKKGNSKHLFYKNLSISIFNATIFISQKLLNLIFISSYFLELMLFMLTLKLFALSG